MKIETIEGMYQTKSGLPVTILATGLDGAGRKIAGIVHHRDGTNFLNFWSSLDDLVKLPQLTDLKVDDKVMVSHDDDGGWLKRHFAGISDKGKMLTFNGGCTSWTLASRNGIFEWNHWRLPTEEEL